MQGQRGLSTNSSEYNAQDFMISQMLGRIATAEPVRVVAVSGSGVSPVGFVDVQPLINLVTGEQKAQEQSVLFKLPYLRIQGGKNALVIDPQPGDIGLAVYAMRDTESGEGWKRQSGVSPRHEQRRRLLSRRLLERRAGTLCHGRRRGRHHRRSGQADDAR